MEPRRRPRPRGFLPVNGYVQGNVQRRHVAELKLCVCVSGVARRKFLEAAATCGIWKGGRLKSASHGSSQLVVPLYGPGPWRSQSAPTRDTRLSSLQLLWKPGQNEADATVTCPHPLHYAIPTFHAAQRDST